MKLTAVAIFMMCLTAFALDTTTSNEYWCTWGYVKSTPVTQTVNPQVDFEVPVYDLGKAESSSDFSSVIFDILTASPAYRFSSFKPVGFKFFFR